MPTYEYLCKTCGHRFETWQKMTDEPLTTCPECGAHIRRVLFPAGVVFKGSGFYKTDHREGASAASAKDDAKPAEATKTDSAAASESKPAESGTSSTTSTTTSESKPTASTSTV